MDRANMKEDQVMDLIGKRTQARKERDFSSSDQIRRDLAAKGIALMDVGKETIWRPCVPQLFDTREKQVLRATLNRKSPPVEEIRNESFVTLEYLFCILE